MECVGGSPKSLMQLCAMVGNKQPSFVLRAWGDKNSFTHGCAMGKKTRLRTACYGG